MGCIGSKGTPAYVANSAIERRVIEALKQLQEEGPVHQDSSDGGSGIVKQQRRRHFNRIILKFPAIRKAFKRTKHVFDEFDADGSGTIEYGELQGSMKRLGALCTEGEVREIFQESDIYHENRLTFREFLVCLAIGFVLQIIPGLRGDGAEAGAAAEGDARALFGEGPLFVDAFRTVVNAYMLFDRDASGTIDRNEVIEVIRSSEGSYRGRRRVSTGASAFLSEDRWHELDADNDGYITFAEFLYGFATWVGLDEDEDEDGDSEEDGGEDGGEVGAGGVTPDARP